MEIDDTRTLDAKLSKLRENAMAYDEFVTSPYAYEMVRRKDYYDGAQFVQDLSTLEAYERSGVISPRVWAQSMGGWGWIDIKAMLPDATLETNIKPVAVPFTKIVVDNTQVVYAVPTEMREVQVGGKRDDNATNLLSKIYRQCDFDGKSDQFCKWTGLFDTCFQYTYFDNNTKRLRKVNLPPYNVFVIPAPEDPTDIQHPNCFVAIAQADQGVTTHAPNRPVWQCWYQDKYWYETSAEVKYKDVGLTVDGINENPYRDKTGKPVKPLVVYHSAPTEEIYYVGSDELVLANQRLDRDITAISHVMEFQGFSVPVITGATPEEVESQPWSPAALFVLPHTDSDLNFKYPVAQVGEFMSAFVKKARLLARMFGVDPELVDPDVSVQSGVAKAQARISLAERREEQYPRWKEYERESYWLTAIVWNTHNKKKLPEPARFYEVGGDPSSVFNIEVVFGSYDNVVDPLADALTVDRLIDLDLTTRVEQIMARRKVDRKTAERIAKEIKEFNEVDRPKPVVFGTKKKGKSLEEETLPQIGQNGNRPADIEGVRKRGSTMAPGRGNNPIPSGDVK